MLHKKQEMAIDRLRRDIEEKWKQMKLCAWGRVFFYTTSIQNRNNYQAVSFIIYNIQ